MATDSVYRKFVLNAKAVPASNKADDNALITIPIVFVIYHLGEPVGQGSNISDADLQAQLTLLNQFYAASTIRYAEGGVDSRIRFAMARRGANCEPINGVVRIDASNVPGYRQGGVAFEDASIQKQLYDLAGPSVNGLGQQAILIRVYQSVSGAAGWASYGGEVVGIGAYFIQSKYIYNQVLAHEIGHVLFLYHTFETATGRTPDGCPVNVDPLQDGDQVADTPPHRQNEPANSLFAASLATINTCTGQPFGLLVGNIMNYTNNKYLFSPGQVARMRGYLRGSLKRFANSPYLVPPDPSNTLVAANCQPVSGSTVSASFYNRKGVSRIRFNTIDIAPPAYAGYGKALWIEDFSCQQQTLVRAGQSYSIVIEAPYNSVHRRVYVDWNNDGAFNESTELAFSTAIGEEVGWITIPANALPSQALRMRVIVSAELQPPTACYLPGLGVAHDYSLRVEQPNTTAQLTLKPMNSFSFCSGQSVVLAYDMGTTTSLQTVSVRAELSDATGNFATPRLLATGTGGLITAEFPLTLASGTNYRIRLVPADVSLGIQQTPALRIRQAPTALLTGPSQVKTGRPISISLALTGEPPWQVSIGTNPDPGNVWVLHDYAFFIPFFRNSNTTDDYFWGYQVIASFSTTAANSVFAGSPDSTLSYRVLSVDNGCAAMTSPLPLSVAVSCSPPENLTEVLGTYNSVVDFRWETLSNAKTDRYYFFQWKESSSTVWNSLPASRVGWGWPSLATLQKGFSYDWRVAITCTSSQTSAFSPTRSFTLSCPIPEKLREQVSESSAALLWDYNANASSATVRWRLAGNPTWTTASNILYGNYPLPGTIAAGQVYEWQVSHACSGLANSAFTPIRSFTISCGPPISLYASSGPTSATLSWWQLSGQRYNMRWRTSGTSTWNLVSPISTVPYILSGLPAAETIEWQVQTICANGTTSSFSETSLLYTSCPAPAITVSGITSYSARINWTAPSAPSQYNISLLKHGEPYPVDAGNISSSQQSFSLINLDSKSGYEIRVFASCQNGTYSQLTNPVNFTTTDCAFPAVSSFSGPQTALVGRPMAYTVGISGVTPVSFTLNTGESFSGITTSPYVFTTTFNGINSCPIYLYKNVVAVSNQCGNAQQLGGATETRLPPNCGFPPTNMRVQQDLLTSVYLSWERGINTYEYSLRWRPVGQATWQSEPATFSNYWVINNLMQGQAYEWQLVGVCSEGQPVTPSPIQSFTMKCPSTPIVMREEYTPTNATLFYHYDYDNFTNLVRSNLRWRKTGDSQWTVLSNLYTYETTSLTGLTPNTAYEWQVQTICSSGLSEFSQPRPFTTTCGGMTNLYAYNVTATTATIGWPGLPDTQYALRWRVPSGNDEIPPSSWTYSAGSFTGVSGSITGLQPDTRYDIQLQPICANGLRAPFSDESSWFMTPGCQPVTATLIPSSATLTCANPSVTLTAGGGSSYSFSTGATTSSIVVNRPGTYSVIVADAVGCTATAIATATVFSNTAAPTATLTPSSATLTCANPSVTLIASGGSSYSFSTGTTASTLVVSAAGTYSLLVTGSNGCTATATATVSSNTGVPPLSISPGSTTLTCTNSIVSLSAIGAGSVRWSTGATSPVISVSAAGSYSVTLTNASGCTANATATVFSTATVLTATLTGSTTISSGQTATLTLAWTGSPPLAVTLSNGQSFGTITTLPFVFTVAPAVSTTYALAGVSDACGTGLVSGTAIVTVPQVLCGTMFTLKAGLWTDPAVWSCNRIPISTDEVEVRHVVTIPAGIANAKRVQYTAGGKIIYESGGRLLLSQ